MAKLIQKTKFLLRGGGCGTSQMIQYRQKTKISKKDKDQDIDNFISRFNFYVEQIFTKPAVATNQQESQEIMIAIQWFIYQEEIIYKLNKNAAKVMKSYDLILEGIRKLLKSCLIYIRTDQFKCYYIIQIITSLSKVIFSFHIMNDERFMKCDVQKEFLNITCELKQQMEIEKNDLTQIQMEIYLFLTKTSFEMVPNNSNEKEEILKGCLNGIITSIKQMKPSAELFEALFQGACLLYKMNSIQNNRKQYEVYFQIDMLQWEIIKYFSNEEHNLGEVISKIQTVHEKLVKNSNSWKNHFLWIQMIGKISVYHPKLTEHKLNQLTSSYGFSSKEIWKQYLNNGLLIQMNYCNAEAIIQLNQFKKKQLLQLDRRILEDCFKEWENFILLQDFLLNEQNSNVLFTFQAYLKCKFELGSVQAQKDNNLLKVIQIQNFFRFHYF
ncbi:unnamed protein product [Paramecium sonneborni]|uniref:Uncharacterized protein n=1 Tax=Paramecium sonneborni TaxID=65129 RepID=A0A8S1N2E8_9CILI|nr:unnamed protein product [Paramecium sonneborni]